MTHGKTYNKSPRRINHKATRSKSRKLTRKGKNLKDLGNGTTIETLQAESQNDSFFPKNGQTDIQNKTFTQTYMQRHTMTDIVK